MTTPWAKSIERCIVVNITKALHYLATSKLFTLCFRLCEFHLNVWEWSVYFIYSAKNKILHNLHTLSLTVKILRSSNLTLWWLYYNDHDYHHNANHDNHYHYDDFKVRPNMPGGPTRSRGNQSTSFGCKQAMMIMIMMVQMMIMLIMIMLIMIMRW